MGRIVLSGIGQRLEGLTWEADRILRIGSQQSMDIVLHDPAVSRRGRRKFRIREKIG